MTSGNFHTQKSCNSYVVIPAGDATLEPSLDISHELRTPLTVIQGALDLLGSGKMGILSDRGERMVKIAMDNVERLMRLTAAIEQEASSTVSLLTTQELARLRLETDLHLALKQNEFRLHYQPIVSLEAGQITGFEVLLRWQHPYLGLVSPVQFIPLAESTGLIIEIGAWVIQEACKQLRTWQQEFPDLSTSLTLSVNLSACQLACPNLAQQIEQILEETGLRPQSLKLEITESSVMRNTEVTELTLNQLQVLGVQLYIDDFGTGYSSLSRLLELPLDVLKIDRSFVQQLCSKRGEHLVRAIANLAENLGIDVIAEGVETEEQVMKLQALGCHRGQGFYFAEPLDSEAVAHLLHGLPNQPIGVSSR